MSNLLGLASKSPRRRELLDQLGVSYRLVEVSVPERREPAEPPADYVLRLAKSKSQAGAGASNLTTLGADTIVVLGDQVLEKPTDEADFLTMMAQLAGATHQVFTAVALTGALASASVSESALVCTEVTLRAVSPVEARRYWATGEPRDKAGGYGIQGFAAAFVERIEGSYSNVVGLPLFETAALLTRHHIPIWSSKPNE